MVTDQIRFVQSARRYKAWTEVQHFDPEAVDLYHGLDASWPGESEMWYVRADGEFPPVCMVGSNLLLRRDVVPPMQFNDRIKLRWRNVARVPESGFRRVWNSSNKLEAVRALKSSAIEGAYLELTFPRIAPFVDFELPHVLVEFPDYRADPDFSTACIVPESGLRAVQGLGAIRWLAIFDPNLWSHIEPHVSNPNFRLVSTPLEKARLWPDRGSPSSSEVRARLMWRLNPRPRPGGGIEAVVAEAIPLEPQPGFPRMPPRIHADQLPKEGGVPELMLAGDGLVITQDLWSELKDWSGLTGFPVELEYGRARANAARLQRHSYVYLEATSERLGFIGGFPHVYVRGSKVYQEAFHDWKGSVFSANWIERHPIFHSGGLVISDPDIWDWISPRCDPARIDVECVPALEVG